jgi:Z1 domain-containing protein
MSDPEQIEVVGHNGGWNVVLGNETRSLLEHLGLPTETAIVVRDEAASVLSRCVAPNEGSGQETGLVVGYVQSGKTMSFTTATALARDNGFAIVIVIAGTSIPLTEQSRERLRRDLRIDRRDDRCWRHLHNPRVDNRDHASIEMTLADWRDSDVPQRERSSVLITVMKNHRHLDNLTEVLRQVDLRGIPVLIFDDEADQAGLNNLVNQGEESTTYQRLLALKQAVPHHTFLQYTATPQGPLLINLIDVLSPAFAATLTPGPDYTGGQHFFLGQQTFVRLISPTDIPSKTNVLHEPPESLLDALRIFFLGAASGTIRESGHGNRSMMVHPSQRTGGHGQYFDWVSAIRDAWLAVLRDLNDPDYVELVDEFRRSYDDLRQTVPDLEPFEDLLAHLPRVIRRTELHLVNAIRGRTPSIDWLASYAHILVGGQALDRGFTVEGLTVTYMPRGVGARRADTVQQRARFFGYKRRYAGFCRVFLEQEVADAFTRYVRHEEDIRRQLQRVMQEGRSLDELRRVFLLPRGMYATRDSIIDVDYVRARFANGWFTPAAPHESPSQGEANRLAVASFLAPLALTDDEGHEARTIIQKHRVATGVALRDVYERLLMPLRFSRLSDAQNFLATLVILRNHLQNHSDATCSLYQISSGQARLRTLNDSGEIGQLFQGAAPVHPPERRGEVYPGDREVHHPNDVTVQIHTLNLERGQVKFSNVVTIAVWMPPGLAGEVLIQDQGGMPDDD